MDVVRGLVAAAVAALASAGCAGDDPPRRSEAPEPRRVVVQAGEREVRATPFGGCEIEDLGGGEMRGTCPQVTLDRVPTPEALPVEAGRRVVVAVEPPAGELGAVLHAVTRVRGRTALERLDELRVAGRSRRFEIRLPDDLPARTKLELVSATGGGRAAQSFLAELVARPRPPEEDDPDVRCPQPFRGRDAPERRLETSSLVGLREQAAERRARSFGCSVRVVRRDGEGLPVTGDLRPDRVNVAVQDGVVTEVVRVG